MESASETIEKLKTRFRIETDSDLAAKLSVSRSTVANWRNRNSVPTRYQRVADGEVNWAAWSRIPSELSDVESAALQLAAMRFVRAFAAIGKDYRAFLTNGADASLAFFDYWESACRDVQASIDKEGQESAWHAMTLIAYDEMHSEK